VDVRFFFGAGAGREPLEDEVFLACGDGYSDLPEKVQAIIRWAYEHGYDYVLKCDTDVVVQSRAMLSSDFTSYDFVGLRNMSGKIEEIHTPWGFCYWLSRKAMKLCIDAPLPGKPGSVHNYKHNNDEAWVSTVLYVSGVYLHDDQRYFLHTGVAKRRRPLQRPLRAPKRPVPEVFVPSPGTFAWCIYLDLGQNIVPMQDRVEEFYKVYEETHNVTD
jgi:hypothetical protein